MKFHNHHILPRSAGGTNNPENLVKVSVEEHAEIHRCLWVYSERWQDKLAWKAITGRIKCEDVIREASKLANTGKKYSKEVLIQRGIAISKAKKGKSIKPRSEEGNRKTSETLKRKYANGWNTTLGKHWKIDKPRSKEHIEAIRIANTGNKYSVGRVVSQETRAKISAAKKGISASWNKSRIPSKETRKKMSEARLRNPNRVQQAREAGRLGAAKR